MVTEWGRWRTHISHSVADPHVRWKNVIHCVAVPQVREMWAKNSPESYGKKVADPPEREILTLADPHFSQSGGPTFEEEQCDALCGRPKCKLRIALKVMVVWQLTENKNFKGAKMPYPSVFLKHLQNYLQNWLEIYKVWFSDCLKAVLKNC